ncbi:MAG: hypothetical protein U5J82_02080 [Desulfobacterales bacterium]|nr:hypothetical protein [Desulfobacterales bacterium]
MHPGGVVITPRPIGDYVPGPSAAQRGCRSSNGKRTGPRTPGWSRSICWATAASA